jgi:DNA-binding PadR family transcriptional regulator
LDTELETLQGEAIRKYFFLTPKGYNLLLKALEEARRTRSEEKRRLYAR